MEGELNVVTGAFGFTGRYITRRLLSSGRKVLTLTGHPNRPNEFGDQVTVASYDFDRPDELRKSMDGASVLFNTYWIRFPYGRLTYEKAAANLEVLINAAEAAGVKRIVHVSIANPSADSPFGYYRGKARVESAITQSGLSYAILRPTVIFGDEGILINNIAWLLRRFPVFAVPGDGNYQIQPIYVEDLAKLAMSLSENDENIIVDAVGPETYTFNDLIRLIARTVHSRARIIHVAPGMALTLSNQIGRLVGDVLMTEDEVNGLMANLLVSSQPPTGSTRLSEWLERSADRIGSEYLSEIKKHYR